MKPIGRCHAGVVRLELRGRRRRLIEPKPAKLGARLGDVHLAPRRDEPIDRLPPRRAVRRERMIEREVEPLHHPPRDGPAIFFQLVERHLRRRPSVRLAEVPGLARIVRRSRRGRLARPRVVARGGVWVVGLRRRLRLRLRQPRLVELALLSRRDLPVERRPLRRVDAVRVRQHRREIGRVGAAKARVVEVDRDVLAADVAARDELIPAVFAVRLFVRRKDDRRLLPLANVAEPHRAVFGRRALGVGRRPLHLAEDGRRHHGRPRIGPGVRGRACVDVLGGGRGRRHADPARQRAARPTRRAPRGGERRLSARCRRGVLLAARARESSQNHRSEGREAANHPAISRCRRRRANPGRGM